MNAVRRALMSMYERESDIPRKLRALWALHVTGGLDDGFLVRKLGHESEYIRAWAVRLLCEDREPPAAALSRFEAMAARGESPYVRLQLASAMQRLDERTRWPIVEALAERAEDSGDQNLPHLVWYAAEPLFYDDAARFVRLAGKAQIPLVRRHVARRPPARRPGDRTPTRRPAGSRATPSPPDGRRGRPAVRPRDPSGECWRRRPGSCGIGDRRSGRRARWGPRRQCSQGGRRRRGTRADRTHNAVGAPFAALAERPHDHVIIEGGLHGPGACVLSPGFTFRRARAHPHEIMCEIGTRDTGG